MQKHPATPDDTNTQMENEDSAKHPLLVLMSQGRARYVATAKIAFIYVADKRSALQ